MLLKRSCFTLPLFLVVFFKAGLIYATHIVGGEIKVKWIAGNTFEVTLTCYRDCGTQSNGLPNAGFDPTIELGVYDKVTDDAYPTITIDIANPTDTLKLGDNCYTPPGICVEKAVYQTTVDFDDNPNGYYISWQRWARNYSIINIISTSANSAGMTFYAEIPDPALHKSTPDFGAYPRAYFCVNQKNTINFSCTDIDNDSLVYTLITPLSATGTGNPSIPPPSPKPYPNVTWVHVPPPATPYYNETNMIGGTPVMTIDTSTGILDAYPNRLGLFVFAVRVEEYDRFTKEKLGEVRRDVQFKVLANCNVNMGPEFASPTINTYKIYAGDSVCFNVQLNDPNTSDSVFFSAVSEMFNPLGNEPAITFSPQRGKKSIQTHFCLQTFCYNIRDTPYSITFNGNDSSCYGKNFTSTTVDFNIYTIDGTLKDPIPNVFTPNGDGTNDFLKVNTTVNNCYDTFIIKIYDRWGDKVFESTDFTFNWDGKHYKTGKELYEGVYFYSLIGLFRDQSIERKGHITLLK